MNNQTTMKILHFGSHQQSTTLLRNYKWKKGHRTFDNNLCTSQYQNMRHTEPRSPSSGREISRCTYKKYLNSQLLYVFSALRGSIPKSIRTKNSTISRALKLKNICSEIWRCHTWYLESVGCCSRARSKLYKNLNTLRLLEIQWSDLRHIWNLDLLGVRQKEK